MMTKYARFDQYGLPLAFYDDALWGENVPNDTIEISDEDWLLLVERPMAYHWDGEKVVEYTPQPAPITPTDIDRERDSRIDGGFSFGGVFYQTRPEDRENIAGASTAALAAIMNGAQPDDYRWHGGDTDFVWIAADNSTHAMDAQTLFAFGQAAMAHKQAHIFAARALKDADQIPADFADDAYWP